MATILKTLWQRYLKARRIRAFHRANPTLTPAEARYLSCALPPAEQKADQLISKSISRPALHMEFIDFHPSLWDDPKP